MIAKLHSATRKLDIPTRTGIFCFSRKGAKTGSGATKSSTSKKAGTDATAIIKEVITLTSDHYSRSSALSRGHDVTEWMSAYRQAFVVPHAEKNEGRSNLDIGGVNGGS